MDKPSPEAGRTRPTATLTASSKIAEQRRAKNRMMAALLIGCVVMVIATVFALVLAYEHLFHQAPIHP